MARYTKVMPVQQKETVLPKVRDYLISKGYRETTLDGRPVFQKGDGVWLAPSYVKLTCSGDLVRLEAWVDVMGGEQDLEGFTGSAVKKPLKKVVTQVEAMLQAAAPVATGNREMSLAETTESATAFCPKCGAAWRPGTGYCPRCGYLEGEPLVGPEIPSDIPVGTHVSKQEFLKKYAGESFYKNLKTTAIVGYVLCGIQLLMVFLNPYSLIDLAICLGLTLGMHLGKSKGCAIGMIVYFGVCVLVTMLSGGSLGGWGWLIMGIYGVNIFNNAEKRYKELTGR